MARAFANDRGGALSDLMRVALLAAALLVGTGCSGYGYQGAVGYRSRQAALQGDAAAFGPLMEEAAEAEPKSRLDNPKKTVLTHFLDLAADPGFLPTVRAWEARGWVDADMVCPVHRAYFGAHMAEAEAQASARLCVDRARAASLRGDDEEVARCLLLAPFLVDTATTALVPYLATATDPAEPEPFRQAVLRGLTFRDGFEEKARWGVTATTTPDAQRTATAAGARRWARRLEWLLDTLGPRVPPTELAMASARGALEVEQALEGLGEGFVSAYAEDPRPERRALAWGWARAMKAQAPVEGLAGLGVWDRGREPAGDAYWYVCAEPPVSKPGRRGPRWTARGTSLAAPGPLDAPPPTGCPAGATWVGPYPLEAVARTAAAARLGAAVGARVRLSITARLSLPEARP